MRNTLITFLFCFSALSASAGTVNNDSVKLVRVAKFDGQLQETWQSTQAITSFPDGAMLYDFGQDAFGQIELTLFSETDDDTAFVRLAECLTPNGDIDKNPGGTRRYRELKVELEKGMHTYKPVIPKDERNTGSSAILMPEEIGEVMPFRYCEVESKYRPETVNRIMITCPFNDETSYFHCDNDTLNNVWDLCKYSIKATSFTGYYIDGDRERIPYEADALINQLCHYSTDAQYDVARRTFEHLLKAPTWPTEWIMQMDMIAYNDYLFTGNTEIRNHYDELVAHTLMALRNDSTGLITTRRGQTEDFLKSIGRKDKISDIVDWPHSGILGLAKGEGGEDDGYEYTDFNTVVNAYHYKAVSSLAEMADALGKKEDAKRFRKYCSQLRQDFNRQLLDKARGIYVDGIGTTHSSLHANMFALAFGLVPEKYKASVADFIVGRGMRCSVYGAQFLLEALYEAGRADEALKLMTSDSDRSWINMLREGSTITMEAWGNKFKPNQDWNHAWGAAPANIIPMRLMGIQPLKPDFVSIRIHPQLSTIRNAECHFPTPKGTITVIVKNGKMTYDVPKGMKVLNK